jgi:hypothetical protein
MEQCGNPGMLPEQSPFRPEIPAEGRCRFIPAQGNTGPQSKIAVFSFVFLPSGIFPLSRCLPSAGNKIMPSGTIIVHRYSILLLL